MRCYPLLNELMCFRVFADNERFELLLAEKGADIMQAYEFMSKTKGQSRNWVGGSVMTKYGVCVCVLIG